MRNLSDCGQVAWLACVAVDRPDGFHPVLSFVLSCPVLSCPSLRDPIPLMQYKTRVHEAGVLKMVKK